MKNYDSRISKLEREFENLANENNLCYAFVFHKKGATDQEIIKAIYDYEGLKITPKDFARWKRCYNNFGEPVILSPNFSIDKLLTQHIRGVDR